MPFFFSYHCLIFPPPWACFLLTYNAQQLSQAWGFEKMCFVETINWPGNIDECWSLVTLMYITKHTSLNPQKEPFWSTFCPILCRGRGIFVIKMSCEHTCICMLCMRFPLALLFFTSSQRPLVIYSIFLPQLLLHIYSALAWFLKPYVVTWAFPERIPQYRARSKPWAPWEVVQAWLHVHMYAHVHIYSINASWEGWRSHSQKNSWKEKCL